MKTILYTPTIDWDFMFQRPQQIMRQFARNGWRVIYINKSQRDLPAKEVEPNLWVYSRWVDAIHDYPHVDALYVTWAKNHILLDQIKADLVWYDSLDDFEVWDQYEPMMLSKAQVVTTTSQILYKKRSGEHGNVHLVRNGCDPDHINSHTRCPRDLLRIRSNHTGPLVGFVGAVGNWVDERLIEGISEVYTTVVIGPEFGNSARSKCINLGIKHYDELPGYYNNIDIFILPFKDTRVARAANPIKMYEYMAAGKPIVASYLPELQLYPGYIDNADQIDEWLSKIKLSSERPLKSPDMFRVLARQHSWSDRYKQIEEILNGG